MNSKNNPAVTRAGIPRRTFLKGILAASALSSIPSFPVFAKEKSPTAKVAANDRVNLACVGIGNRGGSIVSSLAGTGLANIVALCDVDMGAAHTQKILKAYPDVPRFQDFREMLDKMGKQIDALSIGVPDFSHFPIAMMAMTMGKHVYVEKPMAHTFQQVDLMMQAEKKYKVAAQMGNQGHSGKNYFQFKAWTEAGIIKDVTKITAFMNSPRRWHGWKITGLPDTDEPIPSTLDWDKWLATAQFHKYNKDYVNGQWRCWYDFGNGALGDWGAHILDTAHQFLNLGLPEEVNAVHLDGHNQFIFPQASTLDFKFPARDKMPPVTITWYDGVKNLPPLPKDFGDAVWSDDVPPPSAGKLDAKIAPGKVIYGKDLIFKGGTHSATLEIVPKSKMKEMAGKLPAYSTGSDHFKNFLLACKGQEKCRSSFDIAGPLSQLMVLGVIAQRLNAKLPFDRATQQFTNNKVANELLVGPPPRKGWEQYYKV